MTYDGGRFPKHLQNKWIWCKINKMPEQVHFISNSLPRLYISMWLSSSALPWMRINFGFLKTPNSNDAITVLPHNCHPNCWRGQYPATKYVQMECRAFQRPRIHLGPILVYSHTISMEKSEYFILYFPFNSFGRLITCRTHRFVVITWFLRFTSINCDNFKPNQTVKVSVLLTTGRIKRL